MITLLGIDQSQIGPAGFAVLDLSTGGPVVLYTYLEQYKLKDGYHVIDKKDDVARCKRFAATTQRIMRLYPPDVVITEIVRTHHRGKPDPYTAIKLAVIQGAMNVVMPKGVPLHRFSTSSWQAVVLHPKQKDDRKALSVAKVKELFGLELSEHECDAIGLCLAYPFLVDSTQKGIAYKT